MQRNIPCVVHKIYILYINGNIFVIPPPQTVSLSKKRIREKNIKRLFKDSSILATWGNSSVLTIAFSNGNV